MSKSLIRLVLCLCVGHKASALICYTSNVTFLPDVPVDFRNIKHRLQDCGEYISEMSSTETPIEQQVLNCFTISADYLDYVFKGCLPKGRCDSMTQAFQQMIKIGGHSGNDFIGKVHCQECAQDGCNSEDEDSFFLFTNATSASSTTESSGTNSSVRPFSPNQFLFFSCLSIFFHT